MQPLRTKHLLPLVVVIAILLVGSAAVALAQDAPRSPDAQAGKASYAQNCAPCHGETGRGDGPSAAGLSVPPAALADSAKSSAKSLAEWFNITKNGNMLRMMPPWSNRLNDQQIWDTVAYAWTLRSSQTESAMGKAVYAANCEACHGPTGKGAPPVPDLTNFATTSQASDATWAALIASGKGTMPAFGAKLSAAEQRTVVAYARTLSFATAFRGALPKGTGVITGAVTNGSSGQPVANQAVELGIFDATDSLETRTTTTDASGRFRFADLPTDPTLVYASRADFNGIPYGSEPGSFTGTVTALNLPIDVFDTTTDAAGIRADRVHYIVEFDAGEMLVAELLVFSLDGNRAYVGSGMGVLNISIPADAQNLEISDDDGSGRFVPVPGGFVDTLPLPPGNSVRQLLYRYSVPFSGTALEMTRALAYPANNVNALIADVGQQVSSPQLANQGARQTQNGNYITLAAASVAANQPITLRFTNLPTGDDAAAGGTATAAAGTDRAVLLILVGLAGMGAVLLLAWPMLRQRAAGAAAPAAPAHDRAALLDALDELEAAHAQGQITAAAYRDQRLKLKAEILRAA